MDKKKRKKSSDNPPFNQIIDDINQKLIDHSNVVMGELNYKKLKQSDKLLQDSKKKPKLLNESQANVSICDDVIKGKGEGSSGGHGLTGRKIKLVLKKEKEEEKKDDTDLSNDKKVDEVQKNVDENQSSEKDNGSNNENKEEKKDDGSNNEKKEEKKDDVITHENMYVDEIKNVETSTENPGQANLNQGTNLLYKKSMNSSADQDNENKNFTQEKTGDTVGQEMLKNVSDHEQTKEVPDREKTKEILDQESTGNVLNPDIQNKHFVDEDKSDDDQSTTNPFLISGLDAEDGMFSYDSVGIVDNEEILRICSKLNSEKSPQESNAETDAKDDDRKVLTSETVTCDEKLNENISNQMLGVDENERRCNEANLKERKIKLPVERGKDGEENDHSDDDDIMIIEREEEKILIELDSDDDEEEEKICEKETMETDIFPKNRKCDLEPGEITDSSSTDSSSSSNSEEPDSQVQPTWVEIVRQPAPASEGLY